MANTLPRRRIGPTRAEAGCDATQEHEPAEIADGEVPLDALGGHLASRPGHDPRREDNHVERLGRHLGGDALGLAHQAQVRLEERDARDALVAERLADNGHLGALGREFPGD